MERMTIIAAADGSSLGNPGPMGWCWYVDRERWGAGGAKSGTNNIGELLAVAELLDATAAAGLAGEPLRILCDSQYVINSVTKWMPGWKRKGWRKADGKPVMNRELLERIDAALVGREVRFEWVKGHAGHPENEAADERARAAAEAYQRGRLPQEGPGFGGVVDGGGEDAARDRAATGAELPVAELPVAELTADERGDDAADGRGGRSRGGVVADDSAQGEPTESEMLELELDFGLEEGPADEPALERARELLAPERRADRRRLEELLHEALVSIGSDGSERGRDAVIAELLGAPGDIAQRPVARGLRAQPLAANLALVRWTEVDAAGAEMARSAVWANEPLAQNERVWRMRFEQATPCAASADA